MTRTVAADGDENWDPRFGVPGADGPIYTLVYHGGDLYAGGRFTQIGGILTPNIARWDGVAWWPVAGGLDGGSFPTVFAGVVLRKDLYVGGLFAQAGIQTIANIARWDGTNWFPVGTGVNSIVRTLATDGTNLFVGGTFTQAGGIAATNIARWDGTNWSSLGGGIPGQAVDSVAVGGGFVYAGGRFILGGNVQATNIARWDGANWSALGQGLRSTTGDGGGTAVVRALLARSNELYAAGGFRLAGNVAAANIAKWNGSVWQPLGGGIDSAGELSALAAFRSAIVGGGYFSSAGGQTARSIAVWDGARWTPVGTGLGYAFGAGAANALAYEGGVLFVGGTFESAGNGPSTNLALWHIPHVLAIDRAAEQAMISWPATGSNFVLEASTVLPNATWTSLPQPPALVGDQWVVTNALDASNQFYRLRKR